MKIDIKSITPVQPLDVGDTRFEFRVVLDVGEGEETIDLTAEQLTDFRQFQQIALARTGILFDLEFGEANSEFEAYRRWQQTLCGADWKRDDDPSFHAVQPTESAGDEGLYGLADE